jgi:hypothetical protein
MNTIDRLLRWALGESKLKATDPLCCYCGVFANGRIICTGNDSQVVDNPFCTMHFSQVYKATIMTLDRKWPHSLKSEYIAIQKWEDDDDVPDMFRTESELLLKGTKRQLDDSYV